MISGARLKAVASASVTRAAAAAVLALAGIGTVPAQTPAPEQTAVTGRAHAGRRGVPRHALRSGIDARMQLLTAELDLDANQQVQVRQILEEQRTLTLKAWSDESVPSAVRVKTTQVIGEQIADRIRAVLNGRQREKYFKPLPPEARATPNPADLEGYMKATQRR